MTGDIAQDAPRPFSFAVQAAPAKHFRDWASIAHRASVTARCSYPITKVAAVPSPGWR